MLLPRFVLKNWLRGCTIFALSSGALPSAIAIVRISGKESRKCLEELTGKKKFIPKQLFYTSVRKADGELIDRGMAVYLPGPGTFTGEDTVEFYVHGSRAVVDCLSDVLNEFKSVRSAKAGEFTKRAFYNGKMGVRDIECLDLLLKAQTQRQRRLALHSNSFGRAMEAVRNRLVNSRAILEASVDFGDDVDAASAGEAQTQLKLLVRDLEDIDQRMKRGTLISEGVNIAIVGRTNAGKSSIFNALAEKEMAIVSAINGTTRDTLEARVYLSSIPLIFIDTAGIRDSGDPIEAEGISRAIKRAQESDLLLVIIDAAAVCGNLMIDVQKILDDCDVKSATGIIVVCNKCDLVGVDSDVSLPWPVVYTSCVSKLGLDILLNTIKSEIDNFCPSADDSAFFCRQRHRFLIQNAISLLKQCEETTDIGVVLEMLREASDYIGETSGAIVNEEILDKIFSSFCIGK